MNKEKELRLAALNRSEETLRRINEELIEAGIEEGSKEFSEGFASKLLIEFNKALIEGENLKEDVRNLKKQVFNNLKS